MTSAYTLIAAALLAAPLSQAPQTPPASPPREGHPATHAEHAAKADKADKADKAGGASQSFLMHAAQGGAAEVELAQLAKDKASNADVKAFAERLEQDHSKANDELKSLASSKHVTVPEKPSTYATNTKAKLSKLSGAAFDKAYIAAMVEDHQKDIKAFEHEASAGSDADVKAFASKTLPTLKEHLQQAQQLAKSVGAAKATS
jgi:putative membrane protein